MLNDTIAEPTESKKKLTLKKKSSESPAPLETSIPAPTPEAQSIKQVPLSFAEKKKKIVESDFSVEEKKQKIEKLVRVQIIKDKKQAWFNRREEVRALRKLLTETSPDLFNMESPKLLAINIHKELRVAYPQFSWSTLRAFLHKWCNHRFYTALDPAGPRYHLNGTVQSIDELPKRAGEGVVETTLEDPKVVETEQKK